MKTYKVVNRNKLNETVTLIDNEGKKHILTEGEFFNKFVRNVKGAFSGIATYVKKGRDVIVKIGEEILNFADSPLGAAFRSGTAYIGAAGMSILESLGYTYDNSGFHKKRKEAERAEYAQRGLCVILNLPLILIQLLLNDKAFELEAVSESVATKKWTREMAKNGGVKNKSYHNNRMMELLTDNDGDTGAQQAIIDYMREYYGDSNWSFENMDIRGIGLSVNSVQDDVDTEQLKKDFHDWFAAAIKPERQHMKDADNTGFLVWGAPGIGKTQIINGEIESYMESLNYKKAEKLPQNTKEGGERSTRDDEFYIYNLDLSSKPRNGLGAQAVVDVSDEKGNKTGERLLKQIALSGGIPLTEHPEAFKGIHIILMDEMSRAQDAALFDSICSFVFTHRLDDLYLPERTCFIAMSNRYEDHEFAGETDEMENAKKILSGAAAHRWTSVNYIPNRKDWMAYVMGESDAHSGKTKLHPLLLTILKMKKYRGIIFGSMFRPQQYGGDDSPMGASYLPTSNFRSLIALSDCLYNFEENYPELFEKNGKKINDLERLLVLLDECASKALSVGRIDMKVWYDAEEDITAIKNIPESFWADLYKDDMSTFAAKYTTNSALLSQFQACPVSIAANMIISALPSKMTFSSEDKTNEIVDNLVYNLSTAYDVSLQTNDDTHRLEFGKLSENGTTFIQMLNQLKNTEIAENRNKKIHFKEISMFKRALDLGDEVK